MMLTSSAVTSSKSTTMAGIVSRSAIRDARHRRSPAISSNCAPLGRTRIGCRTPCSRMESASSVSDSSSYERRGCAGFGRILPTGTSRIWACVARDSISDTMPGARSVCCASSNSR
jgi:hypothetical protein